ncbi:two-component system, NtrC family, sensor kinase [Phycisphaerales bacterium]|nr:two-component system, NtrC family, sensor kinase [Phycisphaerales bacterium]
MVESAAPLPPASPRSSGVQTLSARNQTPYTPVLPFAVLILTVLQGPDKGRKFELPENEPQLIGRSSEALPLEDNAVSRRHAELTPDDGAWYIRDLQSQNGTWVNGTRIEQRTRLRPGDQVRVGQTLFVFGVTHGGEADLIRLVGVGNRVDASIERTIPSLTPAGLGGSMDDSVILSEPEPRAAAVDHLRVIYRLTTLITRPMDRAALSKAALDLIFAEFKPQRGCILLVGEGDSPDAPPTPVAVKYREQPMDPEDAKIQVSKTILYHAMTKSEGVLSTNAMHDPRFASGDSVQRLHIRSAICSPVRFGERTFGAIYIDSSIANYTFTPEQLALMNAIGQHVGLALANAESQQHKLQSERLAAIGETVATLSHSIKNMLQGLRGGADLVEMGLKKEDLKIAKGGWEILHRNLSRIISLTMNMLAFSRQRRVEVELIRLAPLVEDCVELLEGQAAQKQVALITDVDPEMPPVPLDQALVHQALMNLVTNAIEACPPGIGAITVKGLYRPGQPPSKHPEIEIAVIDNGPGIPAAKQRWIFEPFNTTKGLKGTGLGLAVAKRVAEDHGGRIALESAEGRGATFRMLLPADTAATGDPSATAHSRPPAGPLDSGHKGESVPPRRDDAGP